MLPASAMNSSGKAHFSGSLHDHFRAFASGIQSLKEVGDTYKKLFVGKKGHGKSVFTIAKSIMEESEQASRSIFRGSLSASACEEDPSPIHNKAQNQGSASVNASTRSFPPPIETKTLPIDFFEQLEGLNAKAASGITQLIQTVTEILDFLLFVESNLQKEVSNSAMGLFLRHYKPSFVIQTTPSISSDTLSKGKATRRAKSSKSAPEEVPLSFPLAASLMAYHTTRSFQDISGGSSRQNPVTKYPCSPPPFDPLSPAPQAFVKSPAPAVNADWIIAAVNGSGVLRSEVAEDVLGPHFLPALQSPVSAHQAKPHTECKRSIGSASEVYPRRELEHRLLAAPDLLRQSLGHVPISESGFTSDASGEYVRALAAGLSLRAWKRSSLQAVCNPACPNGVDSLVDDSTTSLLGNKHSGASSSKAMNSFDFDEQSAVAPTTSLSKGSSIANVPAGRAAEVQLHEYLSGSQNVAQLISRVLSVQFTPSLVSAIARIKLTITTFTELLQVLQQTQTVLATSTAQHAGVLSQALAHRRLFPLPKPWYSFVRNGRPDSDRSVVTVVDERSNSHVDRGESASSLPEVAHSTLHPTSACAIDSRVAEHPNEPRQGLATDSIAVVDSDVTSANKDSSTNGSKASGRSAVFSNRAAGVHQSNAMSEFAFNFMGEDVHPKGSPLDALFDPSDKILGEHATQQEDIDITEHDIVCDPLADLATPETWLAYQQIALLRSSLIVCDPGGVKFVVESFLPWIRLLRDHIESVASASLYNMLSKYAKVTEEMLAHLSKCLETTPSTLTSPFLPALFSDLRTSSSVSSNGCTNPVPKSPPASVLNSGNPPSLPGPVLESTTNSSMKMQRDPVVAPTPKQFEYAWGVFGSLLYQYADVYSATRTVWSLTTPVATSTPSSTGSVQGGTVPVILSSDGDSASTQLAKGHWDLAYQLQPRGLLTLRAKQGLFRKKAPSRLNKSMVLSTGKVPSHKSITPNAACTNSTTTTNPTSVGANADASVKIPIISVTSSASATAPRIDSTFADIEMPLLTRRKHDSALDATVTNGSRPGISHTSPVEISTGRLGHPQYWNSTWGEQEYPPIFERKYSSDSEEDSSSPYTDPTSPMSDQNIAPPRSHIEDCESQAQCLRELLQKEKPTKVYGASDAFTFLPLASLETAYEHLQIMLSESIQDLSMAHVLDTYSLLNVADSKGAKRHLLDNRLEGALAKKQAKYVGRIQQLRDAVVCFLSEMANLRDAALSLLRDSSFSAAVSNTAAHSTAASPSVPAFSPPLSISFATILRPASENLVTNIIQSFVAASTPETASTSSTPCTNSTTSVVFADEVREQFESVGLELPQKPVHPLVSAASAGLSTARLNALASLWSSTEQSRSGLENDSIFSTTLRAANRNSSTAVAHEPAPATLPNILPISESESFTLSNILDAQVSELVVRLESIAQSLLPLSRILDASIGSNTSSDPARKSLAGGVGSATPDAIVQSLSTYKKDIFDWEKRLGSWPNFSTPSSVRESQSTSDRMKKMPDRLESTEISGYAQRLQHSCDTLWRSTEESFWNDVAEPFWGIKLDLTPYCKFSHASLPASHFYTKHTLRNLSDITCKTQVYKQELFARGCAELMVPLKNFQRKGDKTTELQKRLKDEIKNQHPRAPHYDLWYSHFSTVDKEKKLNIETNASVFPTLPLHPPFLEKEAAAFLWLPRAAGLAQHLPSNFSHIPFYGNVVSSTPCVEMAAPTTFSTYVRTLGTLSTVVDVALNHTLTHLVPAWVSAKRFALSIASVISVSPYRMLTCTSHPELVSKSEMFLQDVLVKEPKLRHTCDNASEQAISAVLAEIVLDEIQEIEMNFPTLELLESVEQQKKQEEEKERLRKQRAELERAKELALKVEEMKRAQEREEERKRQESEKQKAIEEEKRMHLEAEKQKLKQKDTQKEKEDVGVPSKETKGKKRSNQDSIALPSPTLGEATTIVSPAIPDFPLSLRRNPSEVATTTIGKIETKHASRISTSPPSREHQESLAQVLTSPDITNKPKGADPMSAPSVTAASTLERPAPKKSKERVTTVTINPDRSVTTVKKSHAELKKADVGVKPPTSVSEAIHPLSLNDAAPVSAVDTKTKETKALTATIKKKGKKDHGAESAPSAHKVVDPSTTSSTDSSESKEPILPTPDSSLSLRRVIKDNYGTPLALHWSDDYVYLLIPSATVEGGSSFHTYCLYSIRGERLVFALESDQNGILARHLRTELGRFPHTAIGKPYPAALFPPGLPLHASPYFFPFYWPSEGTSTDKASLPTVSRHLSVKLLPQPGSRNDELALASEVEKAGALLKYLFRPGPSLIAASTTAIFETDNCPLAIFHRVGIRQFLERVQSFDTDRFESLAVDGVVASNLLEQDVLPSSVRASILTCLLEGKEPKSTVMDTTTASLPSSGPWNQVAPIPPATSATPLAHSTGLPTASAHSMPPVPPALPVHQPLLVPAAPLPPSMHFSAHIPAYTTHPAHPHGNTPLPLNPSDNSRSAQQMPLRPPRRSLMVNGGQELLLYPRIHPNLRFEVVNDTLSIVCYPTLYNPSDQPLFKLFQLYHGPLSNRNTNSTSYIQVPAIPSASPDRSILYPAIVLYGENILCPLSYSTGSIKSCYKLALEAVFQAVQENTYRFLPSSILYTLHSYIDLILIDYMLKEPMYVRELLHILNAHGATADAAALYGERQIHTMSEVQRHHISTILPRRKDAVDPTVQSEAIGNATEQSGPLHCLNSDTVQRLDADLHSDSDSEVNIGVVTSNPILLLGGGESRTSASNIKRRNKRRGSKTQGAASYTANATTVHTGKKKPSQSRAHESTSAPSTESPLKVASSTTFTAIAPKAAIPAPISTDGSLQYRSWSNIAMGSSKQSTTKAAAEDALVLAESTDATTATIAPPSPPASTVVEPSIVSATSTSSQDDSAFTSPQQSLVPPQQPPTNALPSLSGPLTVATTLPLQQILQQTVELSAMKHALAVDESGWVSVPARGQKKRSAANTEPWTGSGSVVAYPGLSNRRGDNNCYLNVVLHTLYQNVEYRRRISARYNGIIVPPRPKNPIDASVLRYAPNYFTLDSPFELVERDLAFVGLLSTLAAYFTEMSSNKARKLPHLGVLSEITYSYDPRQDHSSAIDMSKFQSALHRAVQAKIAFHIFANHSKASKIPPSTTRFAKSLANKDLADATEVLEEVLSLLYDAEVYYSVRSTPPSGRFHPAVPLSVPSILDKDPVSFTALHFAMAMRDSVYCPGCDHIAFLPNVSSTWTQYFIVDEILHHANMSSTNSHPNQSSFELILADLLENSEARSCKNCNRPGLRLRRKLRNSLPCGTLLFSLAWSTEYADTTDLVALLQLISPVIDLRTVFPGTGQPDSSQAPKSKVVRCPVPAYARLRGMLSYYGQHWTAFFDLNPFTSSNHVPRWVVYNDANAFSVSSPFQECVENNLQPAMLIYEMLPPGFVVS